MKKLIFTVAFATLGAVIHCSRQKPKTTICPGCAGPWPCECMFAPPHNGTECPFCGQWECEGECDHEGICELCYKPIAEHDNGLDCMSGGRTTCSGNCILGCERCAASVREF
jgi:hypothetical protein